MADLPLVDRIAALAACFDLRGLADEDRVSLAPKLEYRTYAPGELISEEVEQSDAVSEQLAHARLSDAEDPLGLYIIVDGLVQVTHRSQQRRAPVAHMLGAGGLFGEESLTGGGLVGAEAYRTSRLLRLSRRKIQWALDNLPSFPAIVQRLSRIHRDTPWLVDCLRRAPILRHVPPRFLYQLLEGATIHKTPPGGQLLQARHKPEGLYLVLSGEVVLVDEETDFAIHVLTRGAVFGDLEFLAQRGTAYHVRASIAPVETLFIPSSHLFFLMAHSSTFRRGILACEFGRPEQRQPLIDKVFEREKQAMNLIAMISDDPTLALSPLIEWVAESTAAEFGDTVIVLRLEDGGPDEPEMTSRSFPSGGEVTHARVNPNSRYLLSGALDRASLDAHYVFIDRGGMDLGPLAERVSLIERTVYVATRPYLPLPGALIDRLRRPLLYTAVVPSQRLPEGVEPLVPSGSVRVHRDLIEAARMRYRNSSLSALPPGLQEQVGRWARAITDRRVGLALGGGGAFGYAHVPLIRRLLEEKIPIDMVSGVSVGAAVGAYFVARGLEGIEDFLAKSGEILSKASVRGSRYIGDRFDKDFGRINLEDLLVNFLPVVCDIDSACQATLRHGSLGLGVRSSASFPGLLTPTLVERKVKGKKPRLLRLVDGGVINLVPDDTLYLEGAQVVIASNVIPPPRSREALPKAQQMIHRALDALPAFFGQKWREYDPWHRMDDVLRTMYIMMNAPEDWEARAADAKFRAAPVSASPMHWHRGKEIMDAQEPVRLDEAVAQLKAARAGLRWRRPAELEGVAYSLVRPVSAH